MHGRPILRPSIVHFLIVVCEGPCRVLRHYKTVNIGEPMQTKNIAVVGCGFYAENHLHAWKDLGLKGASLAAVCDLCGIGEASE